jgi:hypothetical protein
MVSSRAWFALAVSGVLGLLYVGHGFQNGSASAVHAQEGTVNRTLIFQDMTATGTPTVLILYRAKVPGGWLIHRRRPIGAIRASRLCRMLNTSGTVGASNRSSPLRDRMRKRTIDRSDCQCCARVVRRIWP